MISISNSYKKADSERFQVIGVCNGMVCLRDDSNCVSDYKYIIWNPSISKLVTFPKLDVNDQTYGRHDECHGFAFDAITNDYKVVRLFHSASQQHGEQTFVEVYSLAAGSWSSSRYVDPIRSIIRQGTHAFVHGALHWYAYSSASSSYRYIILEFDVGSESFREIMMPKGLEMDMVSEEMSLRLQMSVLGNSLALFARYYTHFGRDSFLNIWLMKENCVEDSWTKLITLRPQGPGRYLPGALCFQKSGGVVMVQDLALVQYTYINDGPSKELVSLDLVSGQLKNLGIFQYQHYTIDSYMESIVLLDRNDAFSC